MKLLEEKFFWFPVMHTTTNRRIYFSGQ